jgi:pilus assembly protein CpaE
MSQLEPATPTPALEGAKKENQVRVFGDREVGIERWSKEGSKLFRSVVISPNEKVREHLIAALQASGHVNVARSLDRYPTAIELVRTLRAHAAELLFLDFGSVEKALEIVALLEHESSPVQIAAFHETMDPAVMQQSMRAGVREFLARPFDRPAVLESLVQIKALLERRPVSYEASNQIFSFLPSKAGAGASTICLNTSVALARKPDTKVLLADFDLNSGMLRFMLKLKNKNSVMDAVERSDEMDDQLWPQMVTEVAGLDVLHAGGVRPNLRIEPSQIRNLIAFARRHYQVLCFDLSGNLEKYSLELMQESKRILLVCTPEIPSLHLTREKMAFLRECDLADRVSIILNRVHKKALFTMQQVEDVLGQRVSRTFPNDYHGINQAAADGTAIAQGSPIGKGALEFADVLLQNAQPKQPVKHKFLEHFLSAAQTIPTSR